MLDPIAKADAFIDEFTLDYVRFYPNPKETVTVFESGLGRMEDGTVQPFLILEDASGNHHMVHIPVIAYHPEYSIKQVLQELTMDLGMCPKRTEDRLKKIGLWEEL